MTAPALAQEEVTWQTIFTVTTDVNVVNVDVVVTDKQGKLVTGLSAEDFQLFENGEQVEISNFYAAAGEPILTAPDPASSCATVTSRSSSTPAGQL